MTSPARDAGCGAPPAVDYRGYLVELYTQQAGRETTLATIAVDVSSDWKRFPRYGFVADFDDGGAPARKRQRMLQEMAFLNRCHINGVQFQDWQWKHHRPVALDSAGKLLPAYRDISNRWVKPVYVQRYIDLQHRYGMKSIFYNLCFGAWRGAEADGVSPAWGLFARDDQGRSYQDRHSLPPTWQSDIFLEDPANKGWQRYLTDRNEEVYRHLAFDGFQIDQLGYRGERQDARGRGVDLPAGYASLIRAVKQRHPAKRLVMNAVSGYGTEQILATGMLDFCYNEVWGNGNGYGGIPEDQFASLYEIIRRNDAATAHRLQTVFAAYINYDKADHGGSGDRLMNTPGVLLADAVIFALGGAHLELGDHMLSREYFPAAPLAMSPELQQAIIAYYDFHTAYENWLRGASSRATFRAEVTTSRPGLAITAWPPKANQLVTFARRVGSSEVIHLLNFLGTDDLSWRDSHGTRPTPPTIAGIPLEVATSSPITKVWVASPDSRGGVPEELPFVQRQGRVAFTVPHLKYWTMLVLESTR